MSINEKYPEWDSRYTAFLCPTKEIFYKTIQYFNITKVFDWNNCYGVNTYICHYGSWTVGDITHPYFRDDIKKVYQINNDLFEEDFTL